VEPSISSRDAAAFCALSPDLHCIVAADGRIQWASPRWDPMLGYSPEDLRGESFPDLLSERDAAAVREEFERIAEGRHAPGLLARVRRFDGQWTWIDWRFGASDGGAVYGFGRDVSERRRSAAAVEELRTLEDEAEQVALLGSWRFDLGTRQLSGSPQLWRIFGHEPTDPGLDQVATLIAAVHPDDREMIQRIGGQAWEDVSPEVQVRIVLPGGDVRWIDVRAQRASDSSGRVVALTGFVQDATERKRAAAALSKSEERFRAMFEEAAVGMAQVGPGGRWIQVNDTLCDLLGYSREELQALTFMDITHPEDLATSLRRRDLMVSGAAGAYNVEKRYVRKNGSIVWVHVTDVAVRDDDGIAPYYFTVVQDIGERKQAEGALAESQRFVQSILDTTPELIHIYSVVEKKHVYVNRDVLGFLGYTTEEVRALGPTPLEHVVHPDDAAVLAEHQAACQRAADGEVLECEYRVRHSDGGWRWLHSRDVPFARDKTGAVTEILGFRQDVTGRKRADEGLLESNVRLERMVYDVAEAMGRVIEVRDPYTRGHQERVARISKAIATEMGMSANDVAAVEMASLVHDIGKLSIPAEILSMPRKLTPLEFSLIQEHPRKGYEILKDIDFPWPIAKIVLHHHERLDGSGYPGGLKGEVLLPARVLAVADVVEAMASHRPYRPALGLPLAMEELRENRARYDPDVVGACTRLYEQGRLDL
jgi:PAS domain S-box-containing protein/putative nucleotidyltransferase with HDIG domain